MPRQDQMGKRFAKGNAYEKIRKEPAGLKESSNQGVYLTLEEGKKQMKADIRKSWHCQGPIGKTAPKRPNKGGLCLQECLACCCQHSSQPWLGLMTGLSALVLIVVMAFRAQPWVFVNYALLNWNF